MDEEPHAESKKYYSLKLKVYLLVIISTLFLSFVAIILITLGVGSKNIYKYGICLFVMSFLLGGTVLVFIKKIQLGSGLIGSLFQSYVEKSDIIINEFEYPRKNIEKSFNRQFDLVNQSAAAIAQINQMILKTTEQINDCKEITRSAEKRLDEGASTMDKLKESIEVIKSAMEDMDKMLQVINQISLKSTVITDIVAKTELLAMNASIEAARAGEHGKGFSVVSEEVESLARTSGKSAKQIKDLLNESSIKVTQIIRTMNERIKEGEVVSKMACDAYERIKVGVSELKEQIQIIYEGTDMQKRGYKKCC